MTDEELILEIKKGNDSCENEIFVKYKELVTKISRGYFIVGAEIEDLVQEGMIGLYKAIKKYDEKKDASFKTFAIMCIKHQIQSAIKKANTNKNKPLSSAVSLQSFSNDDNEVTYLPIELILDTTPAEEIIDKENYYHLQNIIMNSLSMKEFQVLRYYLQGYSYKEISERLKIDKKSIDNSLSRIKTKLRNKLQEKNDID